MNKLLKTTFWIILLIFSFKSTFAQSITKSVSETLVKSGQVFTYNIQYATPSITTNLVNAQIIDVLPPQAEFQQAFPSSEVTSFNYDAATHTVTFDFQNPLLAPNAGSFGLSAGSTGVVKISVLFPNGVTPNGTLANNTAQLVSDNTSETSNQVSTTSTAENNHTFVKYLISNSCTTAALDSKSTYQIQLCNTANDGVVEQNSLNLQTATLTDTLPTGAIYNFSKSTGSEGAGVYDPIENTLTWNITNTLIPGACRWFTIETEYPSSSFNTGESVLNKASVELNLVGNEMVTMNAESTHILTNPANSPFVSKTLDTTIDSDNIVTQGGISGFNIEIRNLGNTTLTDYNVYDTIPEGLCVTEFSTGAFQYKGDIPATQTGLNMYYYSNLNTTWQLVPGSPFSISISNTVDVNTLGLDCDTEWIKGLRWEFTEPIPTPFASSVLGNILVNVNSDAPLGEIENCLSISANGVNNADLCQANSRCQSLVIEAALAGNHLVPTKEIIDLFGSVNNNRYFTTGETIGFLLNITNGLLATTPLSNPIAADLLPIELDYNGTYTIEEAPAGAPTPVVTQIENYNGTGRTLLKFEWQNYDLPINSSIKIIPNFTINNNTIRGANSFTNEFVILSSFDNCEGSEIVDIYDLDNDGNISEVFCGATRPVNILSTPNLVSEKLVKGQLDSEYHKFPESGLTVPGGVADYRLRVENIGSVPMTNLVIIDILPYVGDMGVIDTQNRLSRWKPNLVGPIAAPQGVSVYYSTETNPCRDVEAIVPTGPVGCVLPNWSTIPPTDITTVSSLKFDFGNVIINPGDELFLEWPMRAPTDAISTIDPAISDSIAWNSFGYIANQVNSSGFVGAATLPSEPIKVGINIQEIDPAAYGNYVWLDSNMDGFQDAGESGISGVRVELYKDNGDGTADPNTDTFINFTATDSNGQYIFPNLDPDNYYAVFYLPATYESSPSNVSSFSDEEDSDGLSSIFNGHRVNITPITELIIDEYDYSWDQGVFQASPAVAAVGNYVWFDENSNNIQDESSSNGINGITVNLYLDVDNDGIAEPNGDDGVPVSSMITSNDVNGNPGYYLFDLLNPDDYFLEFVLPTNRTFTPNTGSENGSSDELDSDPDTNGLTEVFNLADNQYDPSWDAAIIIPTGNLSLGNQVFLDENNDGVFEGTDTGINGVSVNLYLDANANGVADPVEFFQSTSTSTSSGQEGIYVFENLPTGDFIVEIPAANFNTGQPLDSLQTSTGNAPTPDPDDNINSDDNGDGIGNSVFSQAISLTENDEPISDGDSDDNSNLTVDFGFYLGNCPIISSLVANQNTICESANSDFTVSTNDTNNNGLSLIYSNTPMTNPYDGSHTAILETATGDGISATFSGVNLPANMGTSTISYYIYSILSPTPTDPTCRPSQETIIEVFPAINAGEDDNTITVCNDNMEGVSAIYLNDFLSTDANTGGTWVETSTSSSGAFNAGTSAFEGNGLAIGTYTFTYSVAGNDALSVPCSSDVANFTITVSDCALPCSNIICSPVLLVKKSRN